METEKVCCLDVVKELLKVGAKLNIIDDEGLTPISTAAVNGNLELVKLFLDEGSSAEDTATRYGKLPVPLYRSLVRSHHQTVRLLLKTGADPYEALVDSVRCGNLEALSFLRSLGANILNIEPLTGWTLLHRAVEAGRIPIINWLLNKGLDINARDETGNTPLHIAVQLNHRNAASLLLQRKAIPNVEDYTGWTPGIWAQYLMLNNIEKLLKKYSIRRNRFV